MSLPALEKNILVPGFLAESIDISKERAAVKNSVDTSAGPGGQNAIGTFMLAVGEVLKAGLVTQKVRNTWGDPITKGTLLTINGNPGYSYDTTEGAIGVKPANASSSPFPEPAYWVAHEDIPDGGYADVSSTILINPSQNLSIDCFNGKMLLLGDNGQLALEPPSAGTLQVVGFIQQCSSDEEATDALVAIHILPPLLYTAP